MIELSQNHIIPKNEKGKSKLVKLKNASISFMILSICIYLISISVSDADLWGHLRFGLDILASGKIIQVDPYSYLTAGQQWINHEWLAELLYAIAWSIGGSPGLILFKTLIGVLALGIVFGWLIHSRLSPLRAGFLMLLTTYLLLPATASVRPHMFTLLCFPLILLVILQAEGGHYTWLWAAPIIFASWVNLHGGFLAGLGFLGMWAVLRILLHHRDWRKIAPPVLLSFLAVLLNPYGVDLIRLLLRTATVPRPEIVEWEPLPLTSGFGLLYLLLLGISIIGLFYSRRQHRLPTVLLFIVAALLPFVAYRHLPLFALAGVMLVGEHLRDAWERFLPSRSSARIQSTWFIVFPAITGLALLILSYPRFTGIVIPQNRGFFPISAVNLLKQSQVKGNLAVDFNWGEYVIWHLGPDIKVSVDGRRETVYADDIYKKNMDFRYGMSDWEAVLTDFDTDLALVIRSSPADNLISLNPGWDLIFADERSALFASRSSPVYQALKNAALDYFPPEEDGYFP